MLIKKGTILLFSIYNFSFSLKFKFKVKLIPKLILKIIILLGK
jgi:hypothetical protein